jgi:hypothetical protein
MKINYFFRIPELGNGDNGAFAALLSLFGYI